MAFTTKVAKPKASETYSAVGKPLASETWTKVKLETAPAANYADIGEADAMVVDNTAVGPGNNKSE